MHFDLPHGYTLYVLDRGSFMTCNICAHEKRLPRLNAVHPGIRRGLEVIIYGMVGERWCFCNPINADRCAQCWTPKPEFFGICDPRPKWEGFYTSWFCDEKCEGAYFEEYIKELNK